MLRSIIVQLRGGLIMVWPYIFPLGVPVNPRKVVFDPGTGRPRAHAGKEMLIGKPQQEKKSPKKLTQETSVSSAQDMPEGHAFRSGDRVRLKQGKGEKWNRDTIFTVSSHVSAGLYFRGKRGHFRAEDFELVP